jgi:HSP20 family protein
MNVRDLIPWSRGDRERSPATRSDSLSPVVSLHREMNRLFDEVFRGFDDSRLWEVAAHGPAWMWSRERTRTRIFREQ